MYYPSPISQEYDEFGRRIARQDLPLVVPQETVPPTMVPQEEPTLPARVLPTATIQPAPMTPAETEAMQLYRSMPQYTPPGKLDRVLAAIAGGAEGYLSKSPIAGVQAAQEVLAAPRRAQMARWQERVAAIKPQLDIEQRLYERGLDVSKLGLEASRVESTLEAALARVAATREGQQLREKYQNELLEIRRLEALGRLDANEARRREAERLNDYRQNLLKLREKEIEQTGKYRSRMASIAESREKRVSAAKTAPIIPAHQRLAESLATWDVLQDTRLQAQLPAGTNIEDYIIVVRDPDNKERIVDVRLRPAADPRVKDLNIYKLFQTAIAAATQQRLGGTRQGQQQIKLFEDVEEPEDEEP